MFIVTLTKVLQLPQGRGLSVGIAVGYYLIGLKVPVQLLAAYGSSVYTHVFGTLWL